MDQKKLFLPALLLLMVCTFVLHNGILPANIMEARNLTTAREMVGERSWLQPTLNGELRLEKPPLPTWISAATMLLFGQDDLSLLRLPSALAAMLLVFFLFKLTKELTDDYLLPWLTAGTASTSFYILFMARDSSWDIFCHSFMLGAIWLLHKGLKNKVLKILPFIGSAILMGLSFLSKGPVPFYALLLPYLAALCLTRKNSQLNFHTKGILTLVFLTLVLISIWPLYIYFSFPDFAASVAVKESTSWISRNVRPIYHYWSFTAQSGIWVLPATASLFLPFLKKQTSGYGNDLFIVFWTLSAIVLLSIIPEKKERYLFPVLIPLSITTAYYFRSLITSFKEGNADKWENLFLKINGYLMIIVSFLIPVAFLFLIRQGGQTPTFLSVFFAFATFWMIGIFLARAISRKNPFHLWLCMCLMVASATAILLGNIAGIINKNPGYRPYTELRHQPELVGLSFYFSVPRNDKLIEVVWASGRKIQYPESSSIGKLPDEKEFVLLSPEEPARLYPQMALSAYSLETIGLFDANMQKRWGGDVLRNWVTVFRKKDGGK